MSDSSLNQYINQEKLRKAITPLNQENCVHFYDLVDCTNKVPLAEKTTLMINNVPN